LGAPQAEGWGEEAQKEGRGFDRGGNQVHSSVGTHFVDRRTTPSWRGLGNPTVQRCEEGGSAEAGTELELSERGRRKPTGGKGMSGKRIEASLE